MKHFYLIENSGKARVREVAEGIRSFLKDHGCICAIQGDHSHGREKGYRYTDESLVPKETECVIILGGDGTLIQAARDLAGRKIPMIGVNLGTLGYLTQVSRQEDLGKMLLALMNDEYQLETRMMLSGEIYRNGEKIQEDLALNELVVTRRELLKVLKFRVSVNEDCLSQYTADGLIVATPTGSTAYNLSAGGPIANPAANLIILTPICPHALNGRSIVLSGEDRIEVEILGDQSQGCVAVCDGDTRMELKAGDRIRISRSEIETVLIKLGHVSFLDNLREKMAGI